MTIVMQSIRVTSYSQSHPNASPSPNQPLLHSLFEKTKKQQQQQKIKHSNMAGKSSLHNKKAKDTWGTYSHILKA